MLVKRKIRKILNKSLIPYFLNSLNKDKEILVKRSPGLLNFADFSVNSRPIFMKFYTHYFTHSILEV